MRRVTPLGAVTTIAGMGGHKGYVNGVGMEARFFHPRGVVVGGEGTAYVSDTGNHCIRKVNLVNRFVTTLCGAGWGYFPGESGFADGAARNSLFNKPVGLGLNKEGNLIVADAHNHCIRVVSSSNGSVETLAGSRKGGDLAPGFEDGENSDARFDTPLGVAVSDAGAILVTDWANNRVRMMTFERGVTTLAGSTEAGSSDGESAHARLRCPSALAIDVRGGRVLFAETGNQSCLRVVDGFQTPSISAPDDWAGGEPPAPDALARDYGRMLEDLQLADVTFVVAGQRFRAHRCVLAARSAYFEGMFKHSGRSMREGEAGQDIHLPDMSAGAFRVLLRYLYAQELPLEPLEPLQGAQEAHAGGGEGGMYPGDWVEMARVADRFQATGLYAHCVGQFQGSLRADNVVKLLVQSRDSGLEELEGVAMDFFRRNALMIHREALSSLDLLQERTDLLPLSVSLTKECLALVKSACVGQIDAVNLY